MKNITLIIVFGLLALATSMASAMPYINGNLEMTGSFRPLDANGDEVTDASAAVKIDFYRLISGDNTFIVTAGTEHFGGLDGEVGNIKDLPFTSFTGPIDDFWSVGEFSFKLTAVDILSISDPAEFLRLEGTGIISNTNFEDTAGSWSFSGDTADGGTFSWSASSAAVPEPGILALISLGLIGIGIRRKQA